MNEDLQKEKIRKPAAFSMDDPTVVIKEPPRQEEEIHIDNEQEELKTPTSEAYRFGWGALLISSIGGLVLLSFTMWLTSFVSSLFLRQDWIGWLALGLLILALIAAVVLLSREIIGLLRLRRQGKLKQQAELAVEDKDLKQSRMVVQGLEQLLGKREELRWGFTRYREQSADILDADQMLILIEREIIADLDKQAQEAIMLSARRVAVVTTISPAAMFDALFVAFENLRLLRKISIIYGARPGVYGLLKLGRMVLTHITLAGGVALSVDMLQQFMGQRVAAKISAKLGEGLFNGTLTARIGLSAIEVCRPLPFLEAKKPRIRELIGNLVSGFFK